VPVRARIEKLERGLSPQVGLPSVIVLEIISARKPPVLKKVLEVRRVESDQWSWGDV